jgi:hypothetical protein
MSKPALLTIFLHPGNEDQARYLIEEDTLKPGGITYTVMSEPEISIPLNLATPFTLSHREKQVIFTLDRPLTPTQIRDLADYAAIGHIYGFTVKGEINLGETIINNLEGI